MTCAFTRRFGVVYACDLDSGFLERCREAVARFGRVDRLRTIHVPDGRTLDVADGVADLTFSYITLQHCSRSDALALVGESLRVLRPGGMVALNFRQRVWADVVLLPLGKVVRALFTVPGLGPWLSKHRVGHPAGVAGQPARPAPRPRPDPRPGRRRRDLAQPAAGGADLGRRRAPSCATSTRSTRRTGGSSPRAAE